MAIKFALFAHWHYSAILAAMIILQVIVAAIVMGIASGIANAANAGVWTISQTQANGIVGLTRLNKVVTNAITIFVAMSPLMVAAGSSVFLGTTGLVLLVYLLVAFLWKGGAKDAFNNMPKVVDNGATADFIVSAIQGLAGVSGVTTGSFVTGSVGVSAATLSLTAKGVPYFAQTMVDTLGGITSGLLVAASLRLVVSHM